MATTPPVMLLRSQNLWLAGRALLRQAFCLIVFGSTVACFVTAGLGQETVRKWTDATGSFSLQAKLVGAEMVDGKLQAQLEQTDGKLMGIDVDKLSKPDRDYVVGWKSKLEEPKKPVLPKPKSDTIKTAATKPEKKPSKQVEPETLIATRPLGAPLSMAADMLDSRYKPTDVAFDPAKAITIERDVVRNRDGNPDKNIKFLVDVDPAKFALLPPQVKGIVEKLVSDSVPIDAKRRAIDRLTKSWPPRRYKVLFDVLVNAVSNDDKYIRLIALDLLANHDSNNSLAYILARVDDVSYEIRARTFEILTQLRDPRVIPELCERLDTNDRRKISNVLKSFGKTSVPWVIPWLKSESESVVMDSCRLLGDIGDSECLDDLQKLESHDSILVRSQAANSAKRIQEREAAKSAEKSAGSKK